MLLTCLEDALSEVRAWSREDTEPYSFKFFSNRHPVRNPLATRRVAPQFATFLEAKAYCLRGGRLAPRF